MIDKFKETLRALGDWLAKYVLTPIGLVGMALLAFVYVMRERIYGWRRMQLAEPVTLDGLGKLLVLMDDWVAELGCARMRGETLLRFSERILSEDGLGLGNREEIAAWYRRYSCTRYDPGVENESVVVSLAKEFDRLKEEAMRAATEVV